MVQRAVERVAQSRIIGVLGGNFNRRLDQDGAQVVSRLNYLGIAISLMLVVQGQLSIVFDPRDKKCEKPQGSHQHDMQASFHSG